MPSHHLLGILSPSISLFLRFFFFFFFLSFHAVHCAFSTICDTDASSSYCGNISIHYPFWTVSDAAVHCGYPGLGITCSYDSNYPILSLPGDTYFVTEINYADETLTLIDIDVADQRCPRARHNLTFGSLPLDYNSEDVNLTFFFNCSDPPAPPIPAGAIDCLRSGDNQSYVFVDKSPEEAVAIVKEWDCEEAVVAAVKGTEVMAASLVEEFSGAMREGFVLDWEAAKECGGCEQSGGRCAVNRTGHVQCFCDDGSIHSDGPFCKGRNEVCLCLFIFRLSWEMFSAILFARFSFSVLVTSSLRLL